MAALDAALGSDTGPRKTYRRPSAKRRLQLWTGAVAALVIIAAVAYAELMALDVFRSVAASAAPETAATGSITDIATPLSSNVQSSLRDLGNLQDQPRPDLDIAATWSALNLRYLCQLVYGAILVLPVALLVGMLAYLAAVLLLKLDRSGRQGMAGLLDTALDALPYALWMLPALTLAYALDRGALNVRWPYEVYLMVVFFGFGTFLLPFFIHACLRQLRALERSGILAGELVTGSSEAVVFRRLWWYELRGISAYQVIYCLLFIVLLEYSAFTILEFNKPLQQRTAFTQANIYHAAAVDWRLKAEAEKDGFSFRDALAELEQYAPELAQQPWLPRALSHQTAVLEHGVRTGAQDALYQYAERVPPDRLDALVEGLQVPSTEQNAAYFAGLSGFYFWLNAALVFGLFVWLLVGFDIPTLFDERNG